MGLMDMFRRKGSKKQDHMANQDPHTELNNMRGYDDLKRYKQDRKNTENSIDSNA
ncbi:MAG TPA: hypothetical protein VFN56_05025 [Candidatus Saccharimonadales bacterium]|nr:hypothetical protein [Candidatus Saccharimonadales bacterium]